MDAGKQGFFKETQQLIEEYISERLLLLKFQTAEKTAGIVSSLIVGLTLGLLSFLIVFFISATGVYFFARLTGNWYYGFLIIIAIYLVVLIAVYLQRKALYKYFSDLIVSLFFSDSQHTDETDGK